MNARARFGLWLWLALLWSAWAVAQPEFPPLTGRVVDRAGLLSPQAEARLTQMLAAHEQATTEQLVVVTLPDLQGHDIADYGYQLGRHWGIGQKGKDNGALLIVALKERKIRIEVGYGLEGRLTDALSSTIISQVIAPRFKQGDFEGGILQGAAAMVQVLGGDASALPAPRRASKEDSDTPVPFLVFLIFFIVVMFLGGMGGGRRGRRRGGYYVGGMGGFGGGGFGGGGFRGGGGGFGGGGASGGW